MNNSSYLVITQNLFIHLEVCSYVGYITSSHQPMHIWDQDSQKKSTTSPNTECSRSFKLTSQPIDKLCLPFSNPLHKKKFLLQFSHHSTQEAFKVLLIISHLHHLHAGKMTSFLRMIKKSTIIYKNHTTSFGKGPKRTYMKALQVLKFFWASP